MTFANGKISYEVVIMKKKIIITVMGYNSSYINKTNTHLKSFPLLYEA